METVILIGIIQSIFLSILITTKKRKSTADYVLTIWLLFISAHLFYYYLSSTRLIFEYTAIMGIGEFFG